MKENFQKPEKITQQPKEDITVAEKESIFCSLQYFSHCRRYVVYCFLVRFLHDRRMMFAAVSEIFLLLRSFQTPDKIVVVLLGLVDEFGLDPLVNISVLVF